MKMDRGGAIGLVGILVGIRRREEGGVMADPAATPLEVSHSLPVPSGNLEVS